MPPSRYLFLLAAVLAAGGATVLLGVAIAPRLSEGAPWVILSTLAAAAAVALLGRRR
jgi:hypothetical protein